MKLAIDATTEVGQRTSHVLLAERNLEFLGLWNAPQARRTRRSGPITDVTGFDAFVTDRDQHHAELVARSSVAGIPIVMWVGGTTIAPGRATVPIITDANMAMTLGEALTHHPEARPSEDEQVTVSWTEVGKPLGGGHAIAFPDPVGMTWTHERGDGRHVGFRDDEWAAAAVDITGTDGRREVAVADHRLHLEALVLAATVLVAASGGFPVGVTTATERGDAVLDQLLDLELGVAIRRSSP